MKFNEFPLEPDVLKGIEAARFEDCMPVQEKVLALALDGSKDVTVQSQTGSGKTAAFLITLFNQISILRKDLSKPQVKALIMVPTRELAAQIEDEAVILSTGMNLKLTTVYGGVGYGKQTDDLRGNPDIVVATPGRLLDLAGSGKVMLVTFTHLVIDEADRMLDMGFFPDIERILRQMTPKEKRQTMLFSATLSDEVKVIANEFMRQAVDIVINPERLMVDNIEQQLYHVGRDQKTALLLGLLKKYNPLNVLIFTNTKRMAEELARRMRENGYAAEFIIGDLAQKKRIDIIDSIKDGRLKFLVATDVASRGLHIDDLAMVVNFDLPENPENYVHRIGRTARAGKSGIAVTFACESDVSLLSPIEMFINSKIPVVWAEDTDYIQDRSSPMRRREGYGSRDRGRGSAGSGSGPRGGGYRDRGRGRGDDRPRERRPEQHRIHPGATSAMPPERLPASQPAERPQHQQPPVHRRHEAPPTHAQNKPLTQPDRPKHAESQHRSPSAPGHEPTKHAPHQGPAHQGTSDRRKESPHGHRGPGRPVQGRSPAPDSRMAPPGRDSTVDQRLAYYRQRYGGDFKIKELNEKPGKSGKKGLLDGIKGLFKKKNK